MFRGAKAALQTLRPIAPCARPDCFIGVTEYVLNRIVNEVVLALLRRLPPRALFDLCRHLLEAFSITPQDCRDSPMMEIPCGPLLIREFFGSKGIHRTIVARSAMELLFALRLRTAHLSQYGLRCVYRVEIELRNRLEI